MPKDILARLEPCDAQAQFSDLRALWSHQTGRGAVPPRSAFTAELLHPWLPSITILDLCHGRYRFRLVGTGIVAEIGRDLTGQYLDELVAPLFYSGLVRPYRQAAESALPIEDIPRLDPILATTHFGTLARRLILPCSRSGGEIDTFLTCILLGRQVAA